MKPNTSMVQFSSSGGSSTRRGIPARISTYAVSAAGSVITGSRGEAGGCGNSNGDSKGSRPKASGSHERLRPIRRLDRVAQAQDCRQLPNGKEKGRALRKPSPARADL